MEENTNQKQEKQKVKEVKKKRSVRFGLRIKFSLLISFLMLIIISAISFNMLKSQTESLVYEIKQRGIVLAKSLSKSATEVFLTSENLSDITMDLGVPNKQISKENGVLYSFVLGKDGSVPAHSIDSKKSQVDFKKDENGIPLFDDNMNPIMFLTVSTQYAKDFWLRAMKYKKDQVDIQEIAVPDSDFIAIAKAEQQRLRLLGASKEQINEITLDGIKSKWIIKSNPLIMFIFDYLNILERGSDKYFFDITMRAGKQGCVHIIFGKKLLADTIEKTIVKVGMIAGISLLVGLIGAIILATIVVGPIKRLVKGAQIIGSGNLEYKLKVKGHDEISLLSSEFNDMTVQLLEAQKVMLEKKAMEQEMKIATDIQKTLLPKKEPVYDGLNFGAYYQASADVGGDYYDWLELSKNKLGVICADVTGHGVGSGLVMAMTRAIIRSLATEYNDPYSTLCQTNDLIYNDMKPGMFVTVFYGILDLTTNELSFALAGHDPLIVYRKDKKDIEIVPAKGIAVGMVYGRDFSESLELKKIMLNPGDLFITYTDGINEAMNEEHEQLGDDRYYDIIRKNGHLPAKELVAKIREGIDNWVGNAEQSDDITMAAVQLEKGPRGKSADDEIMEAEAIDFAEPIDEAEPIEMAESIDDGETQSTADLGSIIEDINTADIKNQDTAKKTLAQNTADSNNVQKRVIKLNRDS